jgi:hypothetical protein
MVSVVVIFLHVDVLALMLRQDLQKSVLLLRLSMYGLIVWINTKETSHNLDAKPVTEHSDKEKQRINIWRLIITGHNLSLEPPMRNPNLVKQQASAWRPLDMGTQISLVGRASGSSIRRMQQTRTR